MPASSRRIFATHQVWFTKVARVPMAYAYAWFTDYRSDDGKFSKSRPHYRVIKVARDRVVRIRTSSGSRGTPAVAVEIVRLMPPDRWHVDQIDETDLAAVDYRLTRLGPSRTRVELRILERWLSPKHPMRADLLRGDSAYWDRLVAALEDHHVRGRPAVG